MQNLQPLGVWGKSNVPLYHNGSSYAATEIEDWVTGKSIYFFAPRNERF